MTLAAAFWDDFNDNYISTYWSPSGTLSRILEQNQRLEISHPATPAEYNTLTTVAGYDLTDSSIRVKIADAGNQALTGHEVILGLALNTSNSVYIKYTTYNLRAYKKVADVNTQIGSDIVFTPTPPSWWRIREAGGTIYFDTSTDNVTWVNRWSVANPFVITTIYPYLQCGAWQVEASGSYAYFDSFNLPDGHMVLIDFSNDGDYLDTGEAVTSRVRGNPGIAIERGRDQIRALSPPMVGAASVELDNQSKDYSPENSGGPLYGLLLPRRKAEISRMLSGTDYKLFNGYVDDIIQHPEQAKKSTTFTFLDGLSKLRGVKISTPLYQNIRIDQAIGYLLDAVAEKLDIAGSTVGNMSKWGTAVLGTATFGSYGFLGNERVLDTAKTTLAFWWLADEDAFDALVKLVTTEGPGSLVYVDGQGRVRFESRHYRILTTRCTTSQATLDEVSTSEPAWSQLSYDSRLKDLVNYCDAEVKTREVATTRSVVWSLGHSLSIGPSESVTITASGSNPFTGAITPVPGTDYTLKSGAVQVSMNRSSGANVEITIKAGASGATIEDLQLRAYAAAVTRTKTIKSTIDATTSQTRYGERKYTLSLLPEINEHVAQDLVNAVVSMYQSPRSMVSVGMINKNDTRLAQQLSRELSDRITVVDSQTGLNGDLWIERVAHEITDNYKVHRTVFGCEKVYSFPSTSKWGSAVLGTAVFGA